MICFFFLFYNSLWHKDQGKIDRIFLSWNLIFAYVVGFGFLVFRLLVVEVSLAFGPWLVNYSNPDSLLAFYTFCLGLEGPKICFYVLLL